MDTTPSLHLPVPSSLNCPLSPALSPQYQQPRSPFRSIHPNLSPSDFNEKSRAPTAVHDQKHQSYPRNSTQTTQSPSSPSNPRPSYHILPSQAPTRSLYVPQPIRPSPNPFAHHHNYSRPRSLRVFNLLRAWLPIIVYAMTSLVFVVAFALYKTELFEFLDELSHWLRIDEQHGQAILFFLIFLTTFPPIPLYSTLIVLSGYTFGLWTGAIISYFSALTGAITVFILSRALLHKQITGWLNSTPTIKRVVQAIEKRPKLLFLIRLAPYPYNVMNCLLAASPSLTFRTYTICTALSLFKVVIHTALGASIHSFRDFHSQPQEENNAAQLWTFGGVALCLGIFIYLSVVARRAVDEELDDEPVTSRDEERLAFLSEDDDVENQVMSESPFRERMGSSPRPSMQI